MEKQILTTLFLMFVVFSVVLFAGLNIYADTFLLFLAFVLATAQLLEGEVE